MILVIIYIEYQLFLNKISRKTSLEINPLNFLYVFILNMNFKNLASRLHGLIKDRKCFSHACLVPRREGGKKRTEYTKLFFFF